MPTTVRASPLIVRPEQLQATQLGNPTYVIQTQTNRTGDRRRAAAANQHQQMSDRMKPTKHPNKPASRNECCWLSQSNFYCRAAQNNKQLIRLPVSLWPIRVSLAIFVLLFLFSTTCRVEALTSSTNQEASSSSSSLAATSTNLDHSKVNANDHHHHQFNEKTFSFRPAAANERRVTTSVSFAPKVSTFARHSLASINAEIARQQQQTHQDNSFDLDLVDEDESAALPVSSVGWNSSLEAQAQRQKRAQNLHNPIECRQLLTSWNLFKASYPYLAIHLIALGSAREGREQQLATARVSQQTSKAVARLLEEADRLVREHLASTRTRHDLNGLQLNGHKSNAWLARVLANPAYAKLIRHLQLQRLSNGNSISSSTQQPTLGEQASDGHVYGRVAHYPRELLDPNAGKTLDKLHQLSQSSQQQQQRLKQISNELDWTPNSQTPQEESESNRIPLMASVESDQPESSRNKFVYGSVLLRPNQQVEEQSKLRSSDSMNTLRQLSAGLADNRAAADRNDNQQAEPTSESYGRVLVSPARQSDELSLFSNSEQQSRWATQKSSSLDRLRQQLAPHTKPDFTGGLPAATSSKHNDELAAQQAANNMQFSQSDQNLADEFEGEFHSGPLEQVEVRQIKSDKSFTTARPGQVILVD